jgi:predicted nucleic acid-binding protein
MTCADSGFLVSLYLEEATSPVATHTVTTLQEPISVTWLTLLEFENALLRAVFTRRITAQDAAAAKAKFEANLSSGIYHEELVDCRTMSIEASRLASRFTPTLGTRTLDLLHVAAASMLHCTSFLSFDERQRQAAAALGMSVLP